MPGVDPESGNVTDLKERRIRKWEVFPGRNRFYCNGLLMLSTQTGIFYFAVILIVGTSALFFAMDARYLWTDVSPVLPILAALQGVFVVTVLCRTAFGDPGIIPRASAAEAAALEKQIEREIAEAHKESQTTGLPYRPPPRVREVTINGKELKLKYCYTCKIFRPPRASHCSVCDNCVDRFDHHCPWVGNCVGRRNYKYFYLFLTSLTVYCAYLMAVSVTAIVLRTMDQTFAIALQTNPGSPIVALVAFFSIWAVVGMAGYHSYMTCLNITTNEDTLGFGTAMKNGPLSAIVALVAFFSIWAVCGLAGFHSYLTANNMTTNEDIKGSYKESNGGNPFSTGSWIGNCSLILCGPIPPSLIDRRGWVTDDDLPLDIEVTTDVTPGRSTYLSTATSQPSSTPTLGPGAAGSVVPIQANNSNGVHSMPPHYRGQTAAAANFNSSNSTSVDLESFPLTSTNPERERDQPRRNPRHLPPLDQPSIVTERRGQEYLT